MGNPEKGIRTILYMDRIITLKEPPCRQGVAAIVFGH